MSCPKASAPAPAVASPPHLRPHPTKLFVETTTRCNLGCFMCVKQTGACAMTEGDFTPATFAALEPAFPHLEALILNGIGEPLLNPHLEEFIRRARRLMPESGWIGFQTNGLLLTNLRALSLVEAGLDRICLSIDAASPETFRRVREGGELLDVKHALSALVAARERCGRPQFQIGVEFVVMESNLEELPFAVRWAAENGASFAIVTHVLPYDEEHAGESLYSATGAEAIALFEGCRQEAAGEGFDIYRYFEAKWKYAKSSAERRLVEIVEGMKAEAARRGLFVDMKKLLRADLGQLDRVKNVFAAAREAAEAAGIELRLTEVTLGGERYCAFVEEGGAFVSWDGKVSPCYFLWHRYRCFASGWSQQVEPRVFGSLPEQDILAVWNDPAFRSFRGHVLDYDYPDCSSCTLAPCDYVQTDRFEQDCHIKDVPCGACLWCAGVFQCLH